jgi:hypothetical protein
MMVGFLIEFSDAEEAVGNATGAAAFRAESTAMNAAMTEYLWDTDHFVTQVNPEPGRAGACTALTPLRCKHLTVRLQHASRDVIINFIFAARTARCVGWPRYPLRAQRAADCGVVPAARMIIFIKSD